LSRSSVRTVLPVTVPWRFLVFLDMLWLMVTHVFIGVSFTSLQNLLLLLRYQHVKRHRETSGQISSQGYGLSPIKNNLTFQEWCLLGCYAVWLL
jgi:hypothetical protein